MGEANFIVFEGIEGSGKSVQTRLFYDALLARGASAVMTEQPWWHDNIGKLIRAELKDKTDMISVLTLQLLFVANRSNHVEKMIEPSLKEGKIVVADRYWMSTAAYGSTLSKEKVDMNYFIKINGIFPVPDIVFFIDVDPDVAYQRILDRGAQRILAGGEKSERFDKPETLKTLHKKYRELEKLYEGTWININGNRSKEDVAKEVLEKFDSHVND